MVITVSNHKGGVGKTTSVVNIGKALADAGKRVLLIDLDPQANLSQCLNMEGRKPTVYDAMHGGKLEPLEVSKNLHIVPSTLDLSGAETEFSGEAGREFILDELIAPLRKKYDYILIDTPPSLGLLTINALATAEEVFIPLQAHFLAVHGVNKMLEAVDKIQRRVNKRLKLGGIFITQYDTRRTLDKEIADTIKKRFASAVFSTPIRINVDIAEAQLQGLPVSTYNVNINGAQDYKALTREIITRTTKKPGK